MELQLEAVCIDLCGVIWVNNRRDGDIWGFENALFCDIFICKVGLGSLEFDQQEMRIIGMGGDIKDIIGVELCGCN